MNSRFASACRTLNSSELLAVALLAVFLTLMQLVRVHEKLSASIAEAAILCIRSHSTFSQLLVVRVHAVRDSLSPLEPLRFARV